MYTRLIAYGRILGQFYRGIQHSIWSIRALYTRYAFHTLVAVVLSAARKIFRIVIAKDW